ncbi:MAG: hypothetical protein NTU89_02245 [Candidatus Dependentiae bacterium]|nr:hypothetical protein [Candidatus Dependentiae bacterium]
MNNYSEKTSTLVAFLAISAFVLFLWNCPTIRNAQIGWYSFWLNLNPLYYLIPVWIWLRFTYLSDSKK